MAAMLVRNTTFEQNLKPEDFDLRIWNVMYDRTWILGCRNNVPTFWRAAHIVQNVQDDLTTQTRVGPPPQALWARSETMFGPLGEPLKPGSKDFIRSLVNLFMLTH